MAETAVIEIGLKQLKWFYMMAIAENSR